jgi:hypothetical protein
MVHVHELRFVFAQELLEAAFDLRVPHLHVVVEEQIVAVESMHAQAVDFVFDQRHHFFGMLRASQDRNRQATHALPLRQIKGIRLRPATTLGRKLVDHVQNVHRHRGILACASPLACQQPRPDAPEVEHLGATAMRPMASQAVVA